MTDKAGSAPHSDPDPWTPVFPGMAMLQAIRLTQLSMALATCWWSSVLNAWEPWRAGHSGAAGHDEKPGADSSKG